MAATATAPAKAASPSAGALPPGPRNQPFQALAWWYDPANVVRRWQRRYGDCFAVDAGSLGTIVYVADAEAIRAVFADKGETFRAGEANERFMGMVLGRHSVLVLDGPRHLQQRRLMLPPFHGDGLARWESEIEEVTREELRRWRAGETRALRDSMQWITLEVIMRFVIGTRERARRERLRGALVELLEHTNLLTLALTGGRDFGPWRPASRFLTVRARVDEVLYEEIAARRAQPGDDVLSMLIAARDEDGHAMSDEELRDELATLLLAGHETTATALAWAFERLLRHPRALTALRRSLAAGEADYLDAACKEVLRVRPVIMDVGRRLSEPAEVAGHVLPQGVIAVLAILLVHEDARHYGDPGAFRPERFLEGQPDPYTWIPFGGGRRRCLGASFATLEMKTVLRTVLEHASLEPASLRGERQRARNVTLVPSRGARARVAEVRV